MEFEIVLWNFPNFKNSYLRNMNGAKKWGLTNGAKI